MPPIFVGIDVSKETLDVVMRTNGKNSKAKTYANNAKGIAELIRAFPSPARETLRVCLEATGQYGDAVAEQLYQQKVPVSVVNPLCPKRFAQSSLIRNQNDRVDAAILSEFSEARQPRLWQPPSPAQKALRALSRRLDDLQSMLQAEKNRQKAAKHLWPGVKTSIETLIQTCTSEIQTIKRQLHLTIEAEPELKRQKRLLQSIPGIGELTATRFLAELGDLRRFEDGNQLAAFLGLTPASKTSGTSVHTQPHLSKKGPATVRHFLYMPAVVAMRHNPIVVAFAQRLRSARKCELSILGAVMHKLVNLMFGVVHSGKVFDPLFLNRALSPS